MSTICKTDLPSEGYTQLVVFRDELRWLFTLFESSVTTILQIGEH